MGRNKLKKGIIKKNNRTTLHSAAIGDCIKIGELLISKGADINAKDIIYQITINHFLSF